MATETTISRPAPFVEDIGKDLATQAVALTGVPIVTGGIGSLSRMTGETDAGFKARQDAARAFEVRQQNLAGIAPDVAKQDILIDLNLYGSLDGKPNRGPGGIPSLEGDFGTPGGFVGGGGGRQDNDVSGRRDTGTGDYSDSDRPADVAARKEYEVNRRAREKAAKAAEEARKKAEKERQEQERVQRLPLQL